MVGEQQIQILLVDLIQPRKKLKSRHFLHSKSHQKYNLLAYLIAKAESSVQR